MEGHFKSAKKKNPVNLEFYIQRKHSSKIKTFLHKETLQQFIARRPASQEITTSRKRNDAKQEIYLQERMKSAGNGKFVGKYKEYLFHYPDFLWRKLTVAK